MALTKLNNQSLTAVTSAGLPTGSVLQVLKDDATTSTGNLTTTYADVGLSVTITPSSSLSKIWISTNTFIYMMQNAGLGARLLRNGTDIFNPNPQNNTGPLGGYTSSGVMYSSYGFQYLDSPSTTSPITYKIQARKYSTNESQFMTESITDATAYMTVWEIAG